MTISEFSADGDGGFPDEDGDASDWIELHNAGDSAIALGGYFLTDSAADLHRWALPAIDLPPGGLLLVFASGKDRRVAGSELHSNFSLAGAGEYLALVEPDGSTVACEFAPQFPRQFFGHSYGTARNGAVSELALVETPGDSRSSTIAVGTRR